LLQIDTLPVAWAIHRLNGIVTPANPAYTVDELAYQLKSAGAKALSTCIPLLSTAIKAADKVGIPRKHIFLFELPTDQPSRGFEYFSTVSKLVAEGQTLPELELLKWAPGQARTQIAFLCYSSGTSGLPKGVMISHFNIIANVIQVETTERGIRQERLKSGRKTDLDVGLCLLPLSHIYALVAIVHISVYRGDKCVVLPKFDMTHYPQAIEKFRISILYIVSSLT
jgi:acyl-CoA synthetase (AMP-forming)/AMP-acid ligase II